MSSLTRTLVPWKAVLEPAEFVREQPRISTRDWSHAAAVTGRVAAAYLYNFVSYAVPIALAWGAATNSRADWSDGLLISGLSFILLTIATFWWFHVGLVVTGQSRGLLQTFQSVASSTGIYLASAFGFA